MDLCSKVFSTCVLMLSLLGAARFSYGDNLNCPCPKIPQKNLTKPPPMNCFHINDTFRYTCVEGYLRKAGTSNRATCKQTDGVAGWTSPSLQCIPDPRRTGTEPPIIRVPEGPTHIPNDSIITTTVSEFAAAASTSPLMTHSRSSSVSVTAETDSTEPTSPGLQVLSDLSRDFVRGTKETERTTSPSTTTDPSDIRTVNPHISGPELSSTTTAVIALFSLVFVSALIGISCFFHRRRSKRNNTPHSAEEQIPMNGPSP